MMRSIRCLYLMGQNRVLSHVAAFLRCIAGMCVCRRLKVHNQKTKPEALPPSRIIEESVLMRAIFGADFFLFTDLINFYAYPRSFQYLPVYAIRAGAF